MPKGIKVIMYGTLTSKDYSGDFLLRYTAVEQSFKEHRGRRTLAPWQSVVKAEQQFPGKESGTKKHQYKKKEKKTGEERSQ
ncbi:uncharacterized protein LOC144298368 isoform X2 [Canis aureus]